MCQQLKHVVKRVELPPQFTKDSVDQYLINVWNAYCGYLGSNTHIAKVYMYFVSTGRKYPYGYKSTELVLKRMLEEDYDRIVGVCPDFTIKAEYILMISNAMATG